MKTTGAKFGHKQENTLPALVKKKKIEYDMPTPMPLSVDGFEVVQPPDA